MKTPLRFQSLVKSVPLYSPETVQLLNEFLEKGVIIPSKNPLFISRVFSVPKPNGKFRLITDLSILNKFLNPPKFHLPSINLLKQSLPKGSWLAKVDLKDAYLHVPVNHYYQRFLAFRWGEKIFQFQAMPFGLSIAPSVFQGLMNYPLKLLKEKSIPCIAYLDDWVTWAPSKEKCQQNVIQLCLVLQKLGFLINIEKSCLTPSQTITWLGVQWDGKSLQMKLPIEKIEKICLSAKFLSQRMVASREDWEKLLGSLAFAAQVSPVLTLRKKLLGPVLRNWPDVHFSVNQKISVDVLYHLLWWTNPGHLNQWSCFQEKTPTLRLWTDACDSGWGGHTEVGSWIAGDWNPHQLGLSMNLLEIKAVALTLKSHLVPEMSSVRVHSDNLTTVQAIKHCGFSTSLMVTKAFQEVLSICEKKNLFLDMQRIPGHLNVIADALSRNNIMPGEWEIHPFDWQKIVTSYPLLEIDLMATPYNFCLQKFVSPFPHPEAWGVDAWMMDWNQWKWIYLFPPPSQLSRVMRNLSTFRGNAVIIARFHSLLPYQEELKPFHELRFPPQQMVRG